MKMEELVTMLAYRIDYMMSAGKQWWLRDSREGLQ